MLNLEFLSRRYQTVEELNCDLYCKIAWELRRPSFLLQLKEAFDQKQIPAWFAEWGLQMLPTWRGIVA